MATYSYRWLGNLGRQEFHKHFKAICALHKCPMRNSNMSARTASVHAFATAMINRAGRGRVAKGELPVGTSRQTSRTLRDVIASSIRGHR